MKSIVTLRAVIFGVIIFVGVSIPVLFTHFSRDSDARLTPWIAGGIAISVWAIPAVDFLADRLTQSPEAAGPLTAESTSHAPLYELSPIFFTWIVEPALVLGASLLLGMVGFILYEVIYTRKSVNGPNSIYRG